MKPSFRKFYTQSNEHYGKANSQEKHQIKLRTIFKSREGHKIQTTHRLPIKKLSNIIQTKAGIQKERPSQYYDQKLRNSKSMNLQTVESLPQVRQYSNSISNNVIKKLQSLQPQQYQLDTLQSLIQKLEEMDRQAEELIKKKIRKMAKKEQLITLKNRGKDQITQQIQALVKRVKLLQTSMLEKSNAKQAEIKLFTDKKIKLLEKLMAETSIESQVLKKYFFAISTINQQKRTSSMLQKSLQFNTPRHKRASLKVNSSNESSPVCNQSSNQMDYHCPKADQYQTYRYKNKDYSANNQPFPRSSYNREFLINPKMKNFSCKNTDNHGLFGKSRFSSSTYSKDFQRVKTEVVDFKQLDSYRNKIKNIEVSYNFRDRKQQVENYTHKSRKYLEQQLKMRYKDKLSMVGSSCSQQQALASVHSPLLLTTQNHANFMGNQVQKRLIKDRQLDNLRHNYKSLINS